MILEAHFLLLTCFENFSPKQLYFLKLRPIFDNFYSTECKAQKLFKGLVIGFGPKGIPGRMCNIVGQKWGHTNDDGPIYTTQLQFFR